MYCGDSIADLSFGAIEPVATSEPIVVSFIRGINFPYVPGVPGS